MSVYQLKLFGMTCVDFYFKLIPIFILFSRSSQKRSHFGLRVAAVIPALLLLCRALVQLPVFRVFDMYMFLIYILLFAGRETPVQCPSLQHPVQHPGRACPESGSAPAADAAAFNHPRIPDHGAGDGSLLYHRIGLVHRGIRPLRLPLPAEIAC